jgi:four helix bundle protein
MKVQNYKDLIVWQKSIELVVEIYKITKQFPSEEKYGLSSQMQRASVSVPSNIAEGACRNNTGEFNQHLGIAFASAAELETQLIIAKKLYSQIDYSKAENLTLEVQKMLNSLMAKLR